MIKAGRPKQKFINKKKKDFLEEYQVTGVPIILNSCV